MLESAAAEILSRLDHRRLPSSRHVDRTTELTELVNVGRRSRSEDQLSSSSPASQVMAPAIDLLLRLCDSPQQTDLSSDPTLEQCLDNDFRDADDLNPQFYLRSFTYSGFTTYFSDLLAFVLRMPGRLFIAIRSLIELDGSTADVLRIITAVAQAGGVTSPELHDIIPPTLLAVLNAANHVRQDKPVNICYGGCTLRYTPGERMMQDLIAQHRPYTAWSDIASVLPIAYRFRNMTVSASSTLAWRLDPTIGDIESIIISCIGPSLNADSGGWMERYVTPAPIKELLGVGFQLLGSPPALDSHDPSDASGQNSRVRRCVIQMVDPTTLRRAPGRR